MARKLIVEVLADVTSFSHNLKEATVVSEQFSATVTTGTNQAARAVVAASVKTTESLRAQAVAYREIAAAAVVGSEEQIAAARLAEKAELKLAAAMGVTAHEADQLRVHSAGLNRELSHGLRGVASGSGIMHGFGRSLAFASGGFLAFEGASRFLAESVKAAIDAGVAQRSLTAQMKASGESFAASSGQIEEANLRLAKFGFTSEDAVHALTVLERGTGNIQRALSLETVSADLARAKNIDLASAANVVAKVFGGQETALRRAVPGLDKQAHGLELVRLAQQRLAGQAAAGTTAGERFAATLHDTEVIVGTALLPTLNKYLTSLSAWLERTNRSGQLQKDVAGAVKVLTGALDVAKTALDLVVGAFKVLDSVTGSTKETLKLLFSAFVAFKTVRLAATLGELAGSIRRVGTEAETSTGKVRGLRGSLGALPSLVATTVAIDIVMSAHTTAHGVHRYSGSQGWANLWHDLGHPLRLIQNLAGGGGSPPGGAGGNLFSPTFKLPSFGIPAPTFVPHDLPTVQAALPIVGRGGLTAMQRNQLARAAAARTKSTKDDLAALVTQRELLGKAIRTETERLNQATTAKAAKKFAANLQHLYDQDAAAMNEIASLVKQARGRTPAELATQRNTWFDNLIARQLGRVEDIATVGGQITRLQQISQLITQRIAVTKDITRKLNLEDQVLAILQTIKADRAQLQQDAVDALSLNVDRAGLTATMSDDVAALRVVNAKLAEQQKQFGYTADRERQIIGNLQTIRADREEIAQAAHDALSARQFRALGLGATGEELPPTIKALQKQATEVRKALGSMADAKTRQTLAGIGRVLGGGIGKVTDEVKAKIKELLDTISGGNTVDPLAGLRQVSSRKLADILAAGTGLGAAGQRTLAMNIAGAEIQPVHVHLHMDGREVATVVSKQQARTSRRTAKQTSGFRG